MNKSGIRPAANRVLVRPDSIEDKDKKSVIELPDEVIQRYEQGQATGVLVAAGPDAWNHVTERVYKVHGNKERELIEERFRGYSGPFAEIGDRIAFAKFSGLRVRGEDGVRYIVLNDEDITAKVSEGVEFTDLDTRKRVGSQ